MGNFLDLNTYINAAPKAEVIDLDTEALQAHLSLVEPSVVALEALKNLDESSTQDIAA